MIGAVAWLLLLAGQEESAVVDADPAASLEESAYTRVDHLVAPEGAVLEVGGMDWLPDGRLAISTRRGEVWLVEGALAEDPTEARFTRFCEGLWEGLGLKVVEGEIHVLQRGELSRLRDTSGDDRCDVIETLAYDWGLSENYHEFAYGLPVDAQGNFYVTLNVGFFTPEWWLGKARAPYRGWALRISPEGAVTPLASGLRSPCGVSLSPEGELFVTDNQGDWMPASPVFRIREGGFHGHPASLDWTEEYRATATQASLIVPPARAATDREPAALWLPYEWSRSPGNLVWNQTGGRFGPFEGQVFLAELTNGMLLRAGFEEIDGVLQGWVLPFRHNVGSAVRVLFAPDGTLLAGLTNRGWGGLAPSDGIARVRWNGAEPMEILEAALVRMEGRPAFRLRFTQPLASGWLARASEDPASVLHVEQYHYDYWWEYGSPERETTELAAELGAAAESEIVVVVPELEAGRVARLRLEGLTSAQGMALLHDELSYTVNRLPGPAAGPVPHVARIVPPPPARESEEQGWLRLTYGDATDAWEQVGWELVAASLDPDDPTRFRVGPGNSHLTNTAAGEPSHYVSKPVFGDGSFHVEFTLPEGGESTIWAMGRYGLRLADEGHAAELTAQHCGALPGGDGFEARPPERHAYRGPGQLHELDFDFEAPRFDAAGRKTRPARLLRVLLDDVLLHEEVELPGPSRGAPFEGEAAEGPLVLDGESGPVAFGNVRVFPRHPGPERREGYLESGDWAWLVDPDSSDPLAGWQPGGGARWRFEDEAVIGEGPSGYLLSPRDDYTDFELRARIKISDGGNAGIVLGAQPLGDRLLGREAEVNSSFASDEKTGSLIGLQSIRTHLVAPDTWFDYAVTRRTLPEGVRYRTRINGILFVDAVTPREEDGAGPIALQQHHDGSVVEFRDLRLRER